MAVCFIDLTAIYHIFCKNQWFRPVNQSVIGRNVANFAIRPEKFFVMG